MWIILDQRRAKEALVLNEIKVGTSGYDHFFIRR